MVKRLSLLEAGLGRLARRFVGERSGVSAVEFALILPLMLIIYAGCGEVTKALILDRKVSRAASTISDLVAQQSSVSSTLMTSIFDATAAIMEPDDSSIAKVVIVVVNVTSSGQTVAWSKARNDTAATTGAAPPTGLTVPSTIATVGDEVVVGRVTYSYTSPFASVMQSITGSSTYNLSHVFYLKPRQGTTIAFTN
ncbi:TadE/TadG family type IV pilus assembly protein [Pleomorphomonas oryzae]|uniref:TadE/TadG family type IV pilus assembly protein n=1 Tax=Pleomorphomonas oryzae TaxID=261934 RepID=UPI0003F7D3F7|nr:TadE/TadG family type IV pilus assembly protein [Pleomorphomonas oryzae]